VTSSEIDSLLPAFSIEPQPTMLPGARIKNKYFLKIVNFNIRLLYCIIYMYIYYICIITILNRRTTTENKNRRKDINKSVQMTKHAEFRSLFTPIRHHRSYFSVANYCLFISCRFFSVRICKSLIFTLLPVLKSSFNIPHS
jgi:hypothetical protein